MKNRKPTSASLKRARAGLVARLQALEPEDLLRGSLMERYKQCGKTGCHCARPGDPGHGPAYYLSVTLAPGKTRSIYVPKKRRKYVVRALKNHQALRKLIEEITRINRELLKRGEFGEGM